MRASPEFSIDLTAQDLLSLPVPAPVARQTVAETAADSTVEIELTAEQMDAMLSAK